MSFLYVYELSSSSWGWPPKRIDDQENPHKVILKWASQCCINYHNIVQIIQVTQTKRTLVMSWPTLVIDGWNWVESKFVNGGRNWNLIQVDVNDRHRSRPWNKITSAFTLLRGPPVLMLPFKPVEHTVHSSSWTQQVIHQLVSHLLINFMQHVANKS